MTSSKPLRSALLIAAAVICWPTASSAQDQAARAPALPAAASERSSDTVRLSDQARDAILDSNTVESAAAARGERDGSGLFGRGIHGEAGVMIGTGGLRSVYGVAEIPLGDRAGAVVSFESTRFGGYRRGR